MNEEVLNKIEELINKYNEYERLWNKQRNDEMNNWALNRKMGLYTLLQECGYDYTIDESGKIKVIKEKEE